jgi:GNAT superfamily N-acetyltransferase
MSNDQTDLITIDDIASNAKDPFAALGDILRGFNSQYVPQEDAIPVWLFARDATGTVQGGLRGRTVWSWCFVEILAVAECQRGKGIGAQLLTRAEELAKARGCLGIYLTTVAFQAPEFYKKQGYTQFAQLSDYPAGFTHHWFAKRFDGHPIVVTGS